MSAPLLLDEGSPITGTIALFKILVIAVVYVAALYFLLHNWRTSEQKPIGVVLSCLLVFVGVRTWPKDYSWESHTSSDYVLLFFLCTPIVVAILVYLFSRRK